MSDYRSELERRIGQFQSLLASMNNRAHVVARGPCYMIFEESDPLVIPPAVRGPQMTEDPSVSRLLETFGALGLLQEQPADTGFDLPDEGWRSDDDAERFIQFSFERDCFHLDMPRNTLTREEAQQIVRYRTGFFYLSERKQFTLHGEDVEGYDPFRKVYIYRDESSAAEDMAFIFFQVWKFPVDWVFYVKAASFSGKHEWENGLPLR